MTGQRSNQLNYVPLKGIASQWWALSDLNGRPFGCKPNALTAELSALTNSSYRKRQEASTRRQMRLFVLRNGFFRVAYLSELDRRHSLAIREGSGYSCVLKDENTYAISLPSLHFVTAASKLALLHWCKGNAQNASRTGFCSAHGQWSCETAGRRRADRNQGCCGGGQPCPPADAGGTDGRRPAQRGSTADFDRSPGRNAPDQRLLSRDVQKGEAAIGERPQADPTVEIGKLKLENGSDASCQNTDSPCLNREREDAPHSRKNHTTLAPDYGGTRRKPGSGIHRRPRHDSSAGSADSDGHAQGRREDRTGSAQANHFAEKRDTGRQRGVGRPSQEILPRRTSPHGHRGSA